MRRKIAVVVAGMGLALATVPVAAHHAFSAEFDANRPMHLGRCRHEDGVDQPALVGASGT